MTTLAATSTAFLFPEGNASMIKTKRSGSLKMTNQPEKPHFDRIYRLSLEIEERQIDIKELYKAAKESEIDVKLLRRSVRLAMEDEDKKAERRELEHQAH